MNKHKKYLLIMPLFLVIGIFLLLKFVFPTRTVMVVDGDSGQPVVGADVTVNYFNWADGCGNPQISQTNNRGRVVVKRSMGVCSINAIAPEYHINGSNNKFDRKIPLYRQLQQDVPLRLSKVFTSNTGMDVLSYIKNYLGSKSTISEQPSNDFTFTRIASTVINVNGQPTIDGRAGVAHIKFVGEGGVQKISDAAPIESGGEHYFDMENTRIAPEDEYEQEMDIVPGVAYIARLRDGDHYMKFHVFSSKDTETQVDQVCMTAYINTVSGRSVDFLGISSATFCDSDGFPDDYVTKMTYEKLQRDFSKEFFIMQYNFNGKTAVTSHGYHINLNWVQVPGSDFTGIASRYATTMKIPSREEFLRIFEENKGGGGVNLYNLTLIHNHKPYVASVWVPLYGVEVESPPYTIHSVKELCDMLFKNISTNEQVRYNYEQCLLYSFGYN